MHAIGVDIGATNIRVALADDKGRILVKKHERTIKRGSGTDLTAQVIRMIKEVLSITKTDLEDVKGIGIGTIGPLDLRRGIIVKPANLPFDEVPLKEPLEKVFEKPVHIFNDCVAAVIGERLFGVGRDYKNLVYITISTGIGGGVFVDGHLLIGKDGNAHEIGHIVVDIEGKLVCGCGKRGHWEAYASGSGIPKYARLILREVPRNDLEKSLLYKLVNGDLEKLTAKHVYDAAKRGDDIALSIVNEVGRINAIGLANVINVYDPSLVTLGGSVVLKNVELVLKPIRDCVEDYVINRLPRIEVTSLGDDIVLYGAVGAVIENIMAKPED